MVSNDAPSPNAEIKTASRQSRTAYVESMYSRTIAEALPELLPYLEAGTDVLDIGCGPGSITMNVAQAVAPGKVVGTDPSEHSIKMASEEASRAGIKNVTFAVGDAHQIDLPDDSFNVVYSNTALHFFLDPVQSLKEQKRVVRDGGWVIAAGVRDWGFSPRYPTCPNVDAVWDAYVRYNDTLRERHKSGGKVSIPQDRAVPELSFIDIHSGRKCSEWFSEAGLTDLTMQIKTAKWLHPGAERMGPYMADMIPQAGDIDSPWLDAQQDLMAAGFLDEQTLNRAREEINTWYKDPRAFFFVGFLFVAGRAWRSIVS